MQIIIISHDDKWARKKHGENVVYFCVYMWNFFPIHFFCGKIWVWTDTRLKILNHLEWHLFVEVQLAFFFFLVPHADLPVVNANHLSWWLPILVCFVWFVCMAVAVSSLLKNVALDFGIGRTKAAAERKNYENIYKSIIAMS